MAGEVAGEQAGPGLVGAERAQVELDDVDPRQQRLDFRGEREVIQGDEVAGPAQLVQRVDQRVIDELILEQLQDDPIGRDGLGQASEDEVAGDVDPCPLLVDQALEVDLGHRVQRDTGGGELVVAHVGVLGAALAVQQLVADRGLQIPVQGGSADGPEELLTWARRSVICSDGESSPISQRATRAVARDVMPWLSKLALSVVFGTGPQC